MGPQWNDVWHLNYPANAYIVEFDENRVPSPAAVLLGAIGLAYSGWRLRRKEV